MEDRKSQVGRAILTVGSRGSQVRLHGLALLPQERRAEAHSRHGKSCGDRLWHESITEERTDAWRQQISTSRSALGAIAVCPSLMCYAEQGKGNTAGHRVWLFFSVSLRQLPRAQIATYRTPLAPQPAQRSCSSGRGRRKKNCTCGLRN